MKYEYVEETGRRDQRVHNIAVAVLELSAANPDAEGISSSALLDYIRKKLDHPILEGEERSNDLRPHGDAVGGHGLKLATIRIGSKASGRIVLFNKANKDKCEKYLAKPIPKFLL